jgi:superoxide reductase
MTEKKQVYKCPICGNIVEVLHSGVGELVCCGQPMGLQKENTVDASLEKHVPVTTKTATGYLVKIGSEVHPMTPEHHIEWIELIASGRVYRKELNVGDVPEVEFCMEGEATDARAYCNLHGLWSGKI